MKFLHISDLHSLIDYTGKGGPYNKIINNMDEPFKQLDSLLKDRDDVFDFVIVSGDICEYGEAEDYLSVKEKLNSYFSCPVFVCSGNHDNKEELIKCFEKKLVDGELFEEIYFEDIRIIMFDSSHKDYNDGYISEKTCDLLKEALNKKTKEKTILVTHHHLLDDQFTMPKAKYPGRLKDIIKDSDVLAILTGHTHHIYHGNFMGKDYHTTGSLSFAAGNRNGKLEFYEHPSAIIFTLEDGSLKFEDIRSKEKDKTLDIWD